MTSIFPTFIFALTKILKGANKMNLSGNTILITGGSSGLGLEMSKRFLELGNKVIICSRSSEKLNQTKKLLPKVITYQCDISEKEQCEKLIEWIESNHAGINIIINNAAIVNKTSFVNDKDIINKLYDEVNTNFIAPICLIKLLYPVLLKNENPSIINITTGLAYVPRAAYPFYNATKAGLHSFTQVLRYQLNDSPVKIFEVLFPVVDTPWHKGNPPKIAITPQKAVAEMLSGLDKNKTEIRVGAVKLLYFLHKIAPKFAFKKINNLAH